MSIVELALPEGPSASGTGRKKRLGQYFTGLKVARLLAALAHADEAETIIDPMVGSGDMLAACVAQGATGLLAGIEIDPAVLAECDARLAHRSPHLVAGSAFSPQTLAQLPRSRYDLAITNPPYVRYQSTATALRSDGIPTSREVRDGLLASMSTLDALDETDA